MAWHVHGCRRGVALRGNGASTVVWVAAIERWFAEAGIVQCDTRMQRISRISRISKISRISRISIISMISMISMIFNDFNDFNDFQ